MWGFRKERTEEDWVNKPDETATSCAACRRRRRKFRRIRQWLGPVSAAGYYATRTVREVFLNL